MAKRTKKTKTAAITRTRVARRKATAEDLAAMTGRGRKKAAAEAPTAEVQPSGKKPPKDGEAKTQGKAKGKVSCIDAAAQVLRDTGEAMNAKQLIDAIVAKGLWNSPAGKTPHATLFSAIIREIANKGAASRFTKVDRGQFKASAA